MEIATKSTIVV